MPKDFHIYIEKPEIPKDIIDKNTFKEYVFLNYCIKKIKSLEE